MDNQEREEALKYEFVTYLKVKEIISFLIFVLLLAGVSKLKASPQMPDYLIYKGDTLAFYYLILEDYFESINKENEGDLLGMKFREGSSFNCWRGYQAIYEIENDSIFLRNIIFCHELFTNSGIDKEKSRSRIREVFGNKLINGKVHMDWYSGDVSLPDGEFLRWDGVFYCSFETEILISIQNGLISKTQEIKNYINDPDRIDRKNRDTISNVIFHELQKIDWRSIDKYDCGEEYLITIDEDGKIGDISMADYHTKTEIEKFWDRNEYDFCIKTIARGLESLRFDILKKIGIPIKERIYLNIWIAEDGKLENWTK